MGIDLHEWEQVKQRVYEVIGQQKVVTDREIKVRLENELFPWVTARAMSHLARENKISEVGYRGRKRAGTSTPDHFYTIAGTRYSDIEDMIAKKRETSGYLNAIMSWESPAGHHAENVFGDALRELAFTIHAENASSFKGKSIRGVPRKRPGDLDFIAERDGIIYGIDIKNWIKYEADTRNEVKRKVSFARDLGVTPFIIARYVDKDTLYRVVIGSGGICYKYDELIIPPVYESLAVRARDLLGYRVLVTDALPEYKKNWILTLHNKLLERKAK